MNLVSFHLLLNTVSLEGASRCSPRHSVSMLSIVCFANTRKSKSYNRQQADYEDRFIQRDFKQPHKYFLCGSGSSESRFYTLFQKQFKTLYLLTFVLFFAEVTFTAYSRP